jgi:ribosomal protein S18 acetylase RimI-like enzyme
MELVKDDFAGYEKDAFIQQMNNAVISKESFITFHNDEISGLIIFSYKSHEILFLAVNPKCRQKGIAKNLIREVIKCFKPGDRIQVITFREDDPKGKAAVACYHACGFMDDAKIEVMNYPCQKMVLYL